MLQQNAETKRWNTDKVLCVRYANYIHFHVTDKEMDVCNQWLVIQW